MALGPRTKRKTGGVVSKKKRATKRIKKKMVGRVVKKKSTGIVLKSTAVGGGMSGTDAIGNYNFLVEISGVMVGSFATISGLESTTDVVAYRNGGDLRLRKLPGRTHYSNIVFYRGVTTNNELWEWRKRIVDGEVERRSGSIILLDEYHQETLRYNFYEAWPCRWKISGLDAMGNGVLIEELELVIEGLELATN